MDDIMIDRFDVRAHLDHIPPQQPKKDEDEPATKESSEISYERYRVVIQNEFLGLNEDQFMTQLTMEEKFGASAHEKEEKSKKKNSQNTAAIGYNYGGEPSASSANTSLFSQQVFTVDTSKDTRYDEMAKELSDDSDADVDGVIDMQKVSQREQLELNSLAKKYGLLAEDFTKFFKIDEEQRELSKQMKDQDNEKSTGKKHRRDRKMNRDRRIFIKNLDPPSYAAVEKVDEAERKEESEQSSDGSRGPSVEKITFITSFGDDEEEKSAQKRDLTGGGFKFNEFISKPRNARNHSYAEVVRENYDRIKKINQNESARGSRYSRSRSRSRDNRGRRRRSSSDDHRSSRYRRSRSRSRGRKSRSRSRGRRDRSRSRNRNRRRYSRSSSSSSDSSRSRGRSGSRYKRKQRRSRSRSKSRNERNYKRDRPRKSPPARRTSKGFTNNCPPVEPATAPVVQKREIELPTKTEQIQAPSSSISKIAVAAIELPPTVIPTKSQDAPIVKRYYGRRKSNDDSSSSLSASSDDDRRKSSKNEAS